MREDRFTRLPAMRKDCLTRIPPDRKIIYNRIPPVRENVRAALPEYHPIERSLTYLYSTCSTNRTVGIHLF